MSDDERELCGEPCATGGACKNPATEPDGSCHLANHGGGDGGTQTGRRSKLTPERQEAICADLEEGHSMQVASVTNGVSESTYYRWRQQGRAMAEAGEEGPERDFWERTERARREGERRWADRAFEFALDGESFGSVMEILRKRYPESWSPADMSDEERQALEVLLSDDDGGTERKAYATSPEDA